MLGFQDNADYARTREALTKTDYTESAIAETLGCEQIFNLSLREVPRLLRRTRDPSPLNTLIRLMFLGLPVSAAATRAALSPLSLEAGIRGGLIQPPDADGQVAPGVGLWPVRGLIIAADVPQSERSAPSADLVMPPGPVTLQLANAMLPPEYDHVLDLGTGSGILALIAGLRAGAVIASDKNERAIMVARFNARLNDLSNVTCRAGNLFEPVQSQRFQLILCNPPFVISPSQRYLFRDSGLRGDMFCQQLIRSAVDHLEEGGFVQLTANLPHITGRNWKTDLESWFEDLPCDVLVLVLDTHDITDYAMTWILTTESQDANLVPTLFDKWMDYFEKERIEGVSHLLITMRRSGRQTPWIEIDDPPCHVVGPCGSELAQFFAVRDAMEATPQVDAWLDRKLRLVPGVRIEQEHAMTNDGLVAQHTRIRKTGGLQYPLAVDTNVARLLAGCDGSRTLRQNLQEMATYLHVEMDRALTLAFPVIRSLLERNVLLLVTADNLD